MPQIVTALCVLPLVEPDAVALPPADVVLLLQPTFAGGVAGALLLERASVRLGKLVFPVLSAPLVPAALAPRLGVVSLRQPFVVSLRLLGAPPLDPERSLVVAIFGIGFRCQKPLR